MRIYAALSGNTRDDNVVLNETRYPYVLASFAGPQDPRETLDYVPELLLDSGAYSVWTKGETIDIHAYIEWAHELTRLYDDVKVLNLDVIPGRRNEEPTLLQRLNAAEMSAANAEQIRGDGLEVIEVYHRHEPLEILDGISHRTPQGGTLAVGGLVTFPGGIQKREKIAFLDTAFAYLRDTFGWETLPRVHGLGIDGTAVLGSRYPWWSTDSVSWFAHRQFNRRISRRGKVLPYERGDRKTTPQEHRLFVQRKLDRWLSHADVETTKWAQRGIRYA